MDGNLTKSKANGVVRKESIFVEPLSALSDALRRGCSGTTPMADMPPATVGQGDQWRVGRKDNRGVSVAYHRLLRNTCILAAHHRREETGRWPMNGRRSS